MKIKPTYFAKGDPAWHALRRRFITGTDMASLFGLNKYSSPAKVLESKTNPSFTENEFTRMGRILEPAVALATSEALRRPVELFGESVGNCIYYDEPTRISATPDAFIADSGGDIETVVELKSTSPANLRKWRIDLPLHYFMQLATQCFLLKERSGMLSILAAEYPTMPLVVFSYNHTDAMSDLLIQEVARFWNSVESGKSFRVDSKTKNAAVRLLLNNISETHKHGITETEFTEIDWDA